MKARNAKGTRAGKRRSSYVSSTFIDLTGKRFGRLTVVKRSILDSADGKPRWVCVCDCGEKTKVVGYSLRSGGTQSCGCLVVDNARKVNLRHGMKGTRTYRCWRSMLTRCYNHNAKDYARYGGRGIRVVTSWFFFEGFLADMGVCPSPIHTIGRINHKNNYGPDNCRWETPKQQARNRSNNVLLVFNGEAKVLAEWAEQYGVKSSRIMKRIRSGWDVGRAITTPADQKHNSHMH